MFTTTIWFDKLTGKELARDLWRSPAPSEELMGRLIQQHGVPGDAIVWQSQDRDAVCEGDMILVDGEPQPDPDWQPPSPIPPEAPILYSLAELTARVDAIPVSDHSRRNEAQKEFIKTFGIPWIKANPESTPEEAVTALLVALRAEFPADPIVTLIYAKDEATGREDGLLMSYAKSAVKLGLIADPTWQALRALVVTAPDQQLRDALRKL